MTDFGYLSRKTGKISIEEINKQKTTTIGGSTKGGVSPAIHGAMYGVPMGPDLYLELCTDYGIQHEVYLQYTQ